jgi:hypothetical protein
MPVLGPASLNMIQCLNLLMLHVLISNLSVATVPLHMVFKYGSISALGIRKSNFCAIFPSIIGVRDGN